MYNSKSNNEYGLVWVLQIKKKKSDFKKDNKMYNE